MLILTRKDGQSITLTAPGMEPITITTKSSGSSTRLEIVAPDEVLILRDEAKQTHARERDALRSTHRQLTASEPLPA